jgi:hypothetical protein
MKIIYANDKKDLNVIYCEKIMPTVEKIFLYKEDALIKNIPLDKVHSISDDNQFSIIR